MGGLVSYCLFVLSGELSFYTTPYVTFYPATICFTFHYTPFETVPAVPPIWVLFIWLLAPRLI